MSTVEIKLMGNLSVIKCMEFVMEVIIPIISLYQKENQEAIYQ